MRLLALCAAVLGGLAVGGCAAFGSPSAAPTSSQRASVTHDDPGRSSSPGPGRSSSPSATRPLAGKIIGIDPGHNGLNYTDPAFIDRQIWNGREWENCNTTGTATASGYTEARFNFNVATYLAADLRAQAAPRWS